MRLPTHMRAAVTRGKAHIEVENRRVPQPGPGDVLLRVSHCGVCGTDLHFVMDGWGRPDSIGGHEYSGTVVAVGEAVSEFAAGDRVVGGPAPGCGDCDACQAGRPSLCARLSTPPLEDSQGAFAEYKLLPEREVLRVPEALELRASALAEPLAVALHGITLSGIRAGERALVTGCGPIGMLTLAGLRALGVDEVVVSEPSSARRELALKVGATRAIAPDELEIPKLPFELVDDAVHAAFECSGQPSAAEAALANLRRAGTLVLSGTGLKRPQLDSIRVILNELVVTGAYTYDAGGFERALDLLASGRLPTDLLIHPHDVPLAGLKNAMVELVAGRIGGKVLVAPALDEED